jgi:hypothetical protein
MKKVYFAGFKGKSTISKLIRFFTRGEYSHVGYLDLQEIPYEISSTQPCLIELWCNFSSLKSILKMHCQKSSFKAHSVGTPIEIYSIEVTDEQYDLITKFNNEGIASEMKYNWKGIFTFLSFKDFPSKGKAFCSEFHWESFISAGLNQLTIDIPAVRVSPVRFIEYIRIYGAKLEFNGFIGESMLVHNDK